MRACGPCGIVSAICTNTPGGQPNTAKYASLATGLVEGVEMVSGHDDRDDPSVPGDLNDFMGGVRLPRSSMPIGVPAISKSSTARSTRCHDLWQEP